MIAVACGWVPLEFMASQEHYTFSSFRWAPAITSRSSLSSAKPRRFHSCGVLIAVQHHFCRFCKFFCLLDNCVRASSPVLSGVAFIWDLCGSFLYPVESFWKSCTQDSESFSPSPRLREIDILRFGPYVIDCIFWNIIIVVVLFVCEHTAHNFTVATAPQCSHLPPVHHRSYGRLKVAIEQMSTRHINHLTRQRSMVAAPPGEKPQER